ncbi:MAG: hypothetical protein SFU27_14195 [Thermonemataceae bacterium]|nr:hypothetical protein [Thermonemataceae bacterium]
MNKSFIFILFVLPLAFSSCKNKEEKAKNELSTKEISQETEKAVKKENNLISCEGIGKVKFSMSYTDLEKEFGKENILSDTILAGAQMMDEEKTTEDRINTTIKTKEGTLYLTWEAGKEAKKIEKISIAINDNPTYKFANGVSVGTSLKDFKKSNPNGDFEFYGMGWQYAGIILTEEAKGDFFKDYPCFTAHFTTKDGQYDKVQKIMGDGKFKASKISDKEAEELILGSITLIKK